MSAVAALKRVERRERRLLLGAIALGLLVRIAYVALIHDDTLINDPRYYDTAGRLATEGRWLWGDAPYGVPHPTFWKTPGYPLFVGAVYSVVGVGPTKLELVQALLSPLTVGLTWALARRLFDPAVAIAAAFVVAVYPGVWHYTVMLFPEAIAIPAVLAILVVGLGREPTLGRAAVLGLLAGVTLLIRSNSFVFVCAILLGWLAVRGPRRVVPLGAVTLGIVALCLVPWTIRNHDLSGKVVPLSVQDGAISGVFNDDAARDPKYPYAWRPVPERDVDLWSQPRPDGQLLADLRERAFDYIADHPESVPKSIFWNGVTRLWDLRRPAYVTQDVTFEGGRRATTAVALGMYWLMLPLALLGLWRLRHRRDLFVTLVAIVVVSTILGAAASGTRYRATFEPMIVILACSTAVPLLRGRLGRA